MSSALRPRGDERIARELAVAEFLAARGIPACRPTSDVPPGPRRCRGLWLSFWEHLEADADARPSPEVLGARLHELHRGLRDYPGSGAALDVPVSDIGEFLCAGGNWRVVGPADLSGIERRLDAVLSRIGASRASHRWLHGDAHSGNLLRANGERMWTDFEECVFGPVEWDLACLRGSRGIDGAAALRAYGAEDAARWEELRPLAPFRELRQLQAVVWLAVLAERFPERDRRAGSSRRPGLGEGRNRPAYAAAPSPLMC